MNIMYSTRQGGGADKIFCLTETISINALSSKHKFSLKKICYIFQIKHQEKKLMNMSIHKSKHFSHRLIRYY